MRNKLIATSIVTFLLTLSINLSANAVEKRVIIGFHQAPGTEGKANIENRRGRIKREFKHIRAISAEIEESELAGLLNNPNVAYVEEDVMIQAIDPIAGGFVANPVPIGGIEYDNAWSVVHIGAEIPHAQSITGAGVNIAVLDTGIDYNHPDLDMNYSGGDNFISLDANNHDPLDDSYNSHGTHVAGIIAAELDGAGVVGVAPDASIYAVKVLDGAGFGSVSAIVAGIDWAIANQMDIINMSMGIVGYSQLLADACEAAEAAGILIVAAAGNNYGGSVLYPAALPSVIAVGATTIFDEISPISPLGLEMELVAPGLNVYSTVSGGAYAALGGTSQAAPHVSGVAALLLSAGIVNDIDGDGSVNTHDLRLMLQSSATDLGSVGFDEVYGYGLVSASNPFPGCAVCENPITHLAIEKKHKGSNRKDWVNITLEDGLYDVTIANTSLKRVKVKVYEDGEVRHDLKRKINFKGDAPQEVSFSIDASETTLKLVFIPKGEEGSLADVYIQKQ